MFIFFEPDFRHHQHHQYEQHKEKIKNHSTIWIGKLRECQNNWDTSIHFICYLYLFETFSNLIYGLFGGVMLSILYLEMLYTVPCTHIVLYGKIYFDHNRKRKMIFCFGKWEKIHWWKWNADEIEWRQNLLYVRCLQCFGYGGCMI